MKKRSSMLRIATAATLAAGLCAAAPRAFAANDMERCQAAKLKAGSKRVRDEAKCHESAIKASEPLADACMMKAHEKFARAIAKAEIIGWCPGTANAIEAVAGACVANLVGTVFSTPTTTTTTLPCSGKQVGGYCWYLGAPNVDCNLTCAAQGKAYDPATASYAGSGGTDANCATVLAAFGFGFDKSAPLGAGYGCFRYIGLSKGARDVDPTTAWAANGAAERVCACH